MALTILTQTTVTIDAQTDSEIIILGEPTRMGLQIQLQTKGFLWIGLDLGASKNSGFRIGFGQLVDLTLAFARLTTDPPEFFAGNVLGYFEPAGQDPDTGQPPTQAKIRVVSMQ